jgi:hypothetical protein
MTNRLSDPWSPSDEERLIARYGLEGRYTNYFSIGHNALEFVVDFGEMYNGRRERMHSRIVMNPSYAKELLRVLSDSIHSHEEQFGAIQGIEEEISDQESDVL